MIGNEDGLKDKSKKPKNPFRKLEEEDVKLIIEKVQNEQDRIRTSQSEFERDMIRDGGSLSKNNTQKRIGNGEMGYIFGLLDMHNDAFVELTGYPEKNGKIVVRNLKHLRNIIPKEDKIEIRSDGGTEFNNATVRNYCKENNIFLHVIPKASPWIQALQITPSMSVDSNASLQKIP